MNSQRPEQQLVSAHRVKPVKTAAVRLKKGLRLKLVLFQVCSCDQCKPTKGNLTKNSRKCLSGRMKLLRVTEALVETISSSNTSLCQHLTQILVSAAVCKLNVSGWGLNQQLCRACSDCSCQTHSERAALFLLQWVRRCSGLQWWHYTDFYICQLIRYKIWTLGFQSMLKLWMHQPNEKTEYKIQTIQTEVKFQMSK